MNKSSYFIQYLYRLSIEHKSINKFLSGDSSKLLDAERNQIQYPLLWVDYVEIGFPGSIDGMIRQNWKCSFMVVINSRNDDDEFFWMDQAEMIAKDLIHKIYCDSENERIDLKIDSVMMEAEDVLNSDNMCGWRVNLSAKPTDTSFSISDKFTSLFPASAFCHFKWDLTIFGEDKSIEVTNCVLPSLASFDSFEWSFKSTNSDDDKIESIDQNPHFETSGDQFQIQLKITKNGHSMYSTAIYDPNYQTLSGHSVPGQFNFI